MRWTLYFLSYIFFVAQTNGNFEDPNPIVQLTNESYIKGEVKINALNESSSYFAFHAIPYAEPPIGILRFKKPIPYNQSYGNQTNPFDASNAFKQKLCPQLAQDNFIHKDSRDEDCLHLHYTNKEVTEHNQKMLNKLDTPLKTNVAVQYLPKGRKSLVDQNWSIEFKGHRKNPSSLPCPFLAWLVSEKWIRK